jgi:GTP-binding protein EngB required for normal cell division
MWRFAIPTTAALGKLINRAVTDGRPPQPMPPPETTLIKNMRALQALTQKPDPRRVAFLGQPGAGKSTIIRKLSKERARPAPVIGVHTDATNWAERTDVDLLCHWGKRAAADVPGYDTSTHPVSAFLTYFPFTHFGKICLVVHGKIRASDIEIYRAICLSDVALLVVRSRAESLGQEERRAVHNDLCQLFVGLAPSSVVFVSSRSGEGIDDLRLRL